ncbi:metalloregulator ArsR/SmtB family transcription factor [Paenibacillus sediminis]|uniref:ArsR family transcriptional regulator n=1 Tax=Paenibacillus sediminis TaxID=664909 RepID=A0ABS4GY37_9BACL|nr:metalloregulator ArsR/SmtB family transcription factor [Paenibacillus sediminis]MBP1935176.1 putative ArsR family transcriptional regulator [Paenibacillus sediminis]
MIQEQELSTRETILHMLKTQGLLSAKEITTQLDITEMAVRRHLSTLERDGYIEAKMIRQPMGRPTAIYRITELGEGLFPKSYHTLTLDLLGELVKEAGEEMVDLLFEKRKHKLMNKYESSMRDRDLHEKVTILAEIQQENGYMVELEEYNEGQFVLKEHNCPILKIAGQYNQACQCELQLFQSLLDANVERTECLAKGGSRCIYVIKPSS